MIGGKKVHQRLSLLWGQIQEEVIRRIRWQLRLPLRDQRGAHYRQQQHEHEDDENDTTARMIRDYEHWGAREMHTECEEIGTVEKITIFSQHTDLLLLLLVW